jgi:hypothetical protein
VDDPLTHLELTMIHEVMILDHSGPELAAMQYAGALKMTTYAGLIAALLNPVDPWAQPVAAAGASLLPGRSSPRWRAVGVSNPGCAAAHALGTAVSLDGFGRSRVVL